VKLLELELCSVDLSAPLTLGSAIHAALLDPGVFRATTAARSCSREVLL